MYNRDFWKTFYIGTAVTVIASAACAFLNLWCAGITLITGASTLFIYVRYTQRRYREIAQLNDYLSRVISEKYDLYVQYNADGELSILKNNLYKIMLLLRSQNDALRRDKTYLAESLADISHQLKTPLTSLTVMTDLLKKESDSEKRREFTDIIEAQAEKMNWLIVTLLKLSKLDAGTAEFRCDEIHIDGVLKKALSPFWVLADLRSITIDLSCANNFTFYGDENWTVEAIGNIIKNCLEHMEDGGKLCISTEHSSIYEQLTITDDGCGIPKDELPHIFERFYHGKNASANSVGIGLALSKTILEREKAKIEVKSTVSVGTTFDIQFYKTIV